jgi:glycerophosphoryl diester phosphodiesterase
VSPPLVIAHRGDSERRPENTLAAFESALSAGASFVELDVQLSRDGQVVVIHDDRVDRTTSGRGSVAEMTLAEIRGLSAGYPSRFGSAYQAERVPTFAEALDLLRDRARLMVEIKHATPQPSPHQGIEARVIELVRQHGAADGVALISFDPRALVLVRQLAPEITRGHLFETGAPEAVVRGALSVEANVVIAEKKMLSDELRDRAKQAGLLVGGWLVDDPAELEALRRFELFGIGTNRPVALLEALAREPR